jgi:hypothetical protein
VRYRPFISDGSEPDPDIVTGPSFATYEEAEAWLDREAIPASLTHWIGEEPDPAHILVPDDLRAQLLANGRNARRRGHDPVPVVKWFTPDAQATWIITELDPDDPDIAFGLCDLGFGSPELGSVSVSEVESVRGRLGLPVERDLHFHTDRPISAWADASRAAQRITNPERTK